MYVIYCPEFQNFGGKSDSIILFLILFLLLENREHYLKMAQPDFSRFIEFQQDVGGYRQKITFQKFLRQEISCEM